MHDIRQCRYGWRDQFKLADAGFKFCNALVLLRRRLTELLLQSLPCFGVFTLLFKFGLFGFTLEVEQLIDVDSIGQLRCFLG